MLLALLGVVISMLIIWRACDGFESATGYLGRNLSDGVKGATFNAIGSSLPELLATSAALILYVNNDGFAFGIGTTAGSAMFNSAVIPSLVILTVILTGMAVAVTVSKKVILRDGLCLLAAELGLIYLLTQDSLKWVDGAALVSMYLLYLLIMFSSMTKGEAEDEGYEDEPEENDSRLQGLLTLNLRQFLLARGEIKTSSAWFLLGIATIVIGGACHLLVESCYLLGDTLNINTYFIAVILAAAATSVPDTILSIKDAKNGNYDDAVANALGSNIFDICVGLGLPLLVYCLMTGNSISLITGDSGNVAELRILLLGITAIIFLILLFAKSLKKRHSLAILSLYATFVVYIIGRANEVEVFNQIGIGLQNTLKFIGG